MLLGHFQGNDTDVSFQHVPFFQGHIGSYTLFTGYFEQVALEKVFNFATTNIFETRVAGRMVADMCRAAAKVSLV